MSSCAPAVCQCDEPFFLFRVPLQFNRAVARTGSEVGRFL